MIYLLQVPPGLAPFPHIFAELSPRILGIAIWLVFTVLLLVYVFEVKDADPRRLLGVQVPTLFAAGLLTGFLPSPGNFTVTGSMNQYRFSQSGGVVLQATGTATTTAELYDPSSGTLPTSRASPMSAKRAKGLTCCGRLRHGALPLDMITYFIMLAIEPVSSFRFALVALSSNKWKM